jgi:alpha-D-ribose 1-methylphosphonate 5-triphosphate synthase subunit PhnG
MKRKVERMFPVAETFLFDTETRRKWMAALAKAIPEELEHLWSTLKEKPGYYFLRPPEVGLVMVRGRAGGTGMRFNIGEVTVTRCAVQVNDGAVGTAYVLGRNVRHAELAALFDAMLQDPNRHTALMKKVINPMIVSIRDRKRRAAQKAAATKVEFFTLMRGDE